MEVQHKSELEITNTEDKILEVCQQLLGVIIIVHKTKFLSFVKRLATKSKKWIERCEEKQNLRRT